MIFSQFKKNKRSGFKQPPNSVTTQAFVFGLGGESLPDKYTWDAVFASIDAGTYKTDYAIGDCVPLDLGSVGLINMQIAAFDADDLADGSGKAPITWIAKELLAYTRVMNPAIVSYGDGTYKEGTGAIGGWEKTSMRVYLKETIKLLIPEVVRNSIKEVTKTQTAYDTNNYEFSQTSVEDVWVPDETEMFGSSSLYKTMFPDDDSRIKTVVNSTSKRAWWLRSTESNNKFAQVSTFGRLSSSGVEYPCGIAICFCTGKSA